jgi:putative transposase
MERCQAIKVRLYPDEHQEAVFTRIAGCCRLVYNLGLEQRRDHWRNFKATTGKHVSWYSQKREIVGLKEVAPFLSEVPSHCLQQALANLNRAYDRFFKGVAGYPKPRKRFQHDSFTFPDPAQIRLDIPKGVLRLPKFMGPGPSGKARAGDNGAIKARFHRPVRGQLRSVTVSRSGGHWYASILVKVQVGKPRSKTPTMANGAGLDRGVTQPSAVSTGEMLGAAVETPRVREREKRLARKVSRAQRGSANHKKAKKRLACHKAKSVRKRADVVHKTSSHLVQNHDWVAIEALKVQAMTASARGTVEQPGKGVAQKSGLNRSILDKAWGMLRAQLLYKMAWKGGRVVEVSAAYSSQTCAVCHKVDAKSRKGAVFHCTSCGHLDHADTNAARIIHHRALVQLGLVLQDQVQTHPAEGMAAAAPGELCRDVGVFHGISVKGEENRRPKPGKDPNKAVVPPPPRLRGEGVTQARRSPFL